MKDVGRFNLANGNDSGEPFVPEPMLADIMDAFDTLSVLTSALGFAVLEPRAKAEAEEFFYCTRKTRDGVECRGKGYLGDDGFTVVAGSRGRREVAAYAGGWLASTRGELLESGVIREDGGTITFVEDYTFNTPSAAAMMIIGSSANGWTEWKTQSGTTLDQEKRGPSENDEPPVADAPDQSLLQ